MIGYYVHHQGRGHLHRAQCIAAHVPGPVTILSSLPRPEAWQGPWVALPPDTTDDPVDATARGRLHWVPVHHDGHRARMGIIAEWITQTRPAVFVSDVSVEAAILARLMGIPVVVAAMRGDRRDEAHRLGYDLADALLAPWPSSLPEPGWPAHWHAKSVHTGSISRYDGRPRPVTRGGRDRHGAANEVVVMLGAGGADVTPEQVRDAADATPGWSWTVLGGAETPGSRTRGRSCAARASSSPMRDRTPSRNAPPRARPPS
ncbi:hypothetical protein N7U49_01810 [Streptomyces sp. AD2-2]|nr:hypothetical protein N7U49_01810 [Streptomyces sp. AD2-2]